MTRPDTKRHDIVIRPQTNGKWEMMYHAEGKWIFLGYSHIPLFAGARALLRAGWAAPHERLATTDPDGTVRMEASSVGFAAGLTVAENPPPVHVKTHDATALERLNASKARVARPNAENPLSEPATGEENDV